MESQTPVPKMSSEHVQKTLFKNAKSSKKAFANFIRYWNEHQEEFADFSEEERKALKDLRELWNRIDEKCSMDYFFGMKDHHNCLNGRLMIRKRYDLWAKYMRGFVVWRAEMTKLMVDVAQQKT